MPTKDLSFPALAAVEAKLEQAFAELGENMDFTALKSIPARRRRRPRKSSGSTTSVSRC